MLALGLRTHQRGQRQTQGAMDQDLRRNSYNSQEGGFFVQEKFEIIIIQRKLFELLIIQRKLFKIIIIRGK